MRPAIGGEKAVLSPQSSILNPQSSVFSPQKCPKQCLCSQKLDLWHFSRECRENLKIRTLRIKFRNKSVFEDSPNLCQPGGRRRPMFRPCILSDCDNMLSLEYSDQLKQYSDDHFESNGMTNK